MRYTLTSVLCGVALLTGCRHHKPAVQSHGLEVITVDPAHDRAVGIAVVQAHSALADWITNADGSRSDPTYKAGSKTTKTGQGKETKTACTRSHLEFQTKKLGPVRIETIQITDKTIVLLIETQSEEAAAEVHNTLLKELNEKCKNP